VALLPGQFYRVARAWREHRAGERWQLLDSDDDRLEVRLPLGTRLSVPVEIAPHLERIETLGWEARPACRCTPPSLTQVLGDPDCAVLACSACRMVFAFEPRSDGVRPLPLDDAACSLVWAALLLSPDAPLRTRLETAIACAVPPADRIVAARLWREGFATELAAVLSGDDASLRMLALDAVGRLREVPLVVAKALEALVRHPRDRDPVGDERLALVAALYSAAPHLVSLRQSVVWDRHHAAQASGERAAFVVRVIDAVLKRMSDERALIEAQVCARVRAGDREAAAHAAERLSEPDDRGALLESAGDALAATHPDGARWLYALAHDQFSIFASWASSGAEGIGRMVDVRRLEAKARGA
jgi:hypothetical protein